MLVERGQGAFLVRVVDQEKPPVLLVAPAGCPNGGIEDAGLDIQWDGIWLHPSHGAGRVEGFVEFHGCADYAG